MSRYSDQRGFTIIEAVVFITIVGVALSSIVFLYLSNAGQSHQPLIRQKAISVASAYMDEISGKRWDESTPIGGGCVISGAGNCEAAWVANASYAALTVVVPNAANGHKYRSLGSGVSGAVEPVWPTDGSTLVDGTLTWEDMGDFSITSDCDASPSNCGPDGSEQRDDYDDIDDYNGLSDDPPQYPDQSVASGQSPMPGYDGYSVSVSVTAEAWNGIPAADTRRIEVTVSTPMQERFTLVAYRLNL